MKKQAPVVLVIEDDVWFAKQHGRVLEEAGFIVRYAADGLAGIAAIDEKMPDLIVLDFFLPGPNALVLLHEMQSYSDLSSLPVVLCTNSSIDVPTSTLDAYGVRVVLDKGSMQPRDLIAAVRRILL